jgi:hypothetical protein
MTNTKVEMHDLIAEYIANSDDVRDEIIDLSSLNEEDTMNIMSNCEYEYYDLVQADEEADDAELDAIIEYAVNKLI